MDQWYSWLHEKTEEGREEEKIRGASGIELVSCTGSRSQQRGEEVCRSLEKWKKMPNAWRRCE